MQQKFICRSKKQYQKKVIAVYTRPLTTREFLNGYNSIRVFDRTGLLINASGVKELVTFCQKCIDHYRAAGFEQTHSDESWSLCDIFLDKLTEEIKRIFEKWEKMTETAPEKSDIAQNIKKLLELSTAVEKIC